MSWDVSVQRFGKRYASASEIPEDETSQGLGTPEAVREAISSEFPGTNWRDQTWGVYDSNIGSIEFNMGSNQGTDGFMMHVRADEAIVDKIVLLLKANSWQGLDCSSGEFLEQTSAPKEGIRSWIGYVAGMRR